MSRRPMQPIPIDESAPIKADLAVPADSERFPAMFFSPSPSRIALVSGLAASLALTGCGGPEPSGDNDSKNQSARKDFTHPRELVVGEDGLARRGEESEPYTGAAIMRDADWNLRYFAYYQDGKLHGPEMKFWEDGKVRRNFDYDQGEKTRHREWFENGNPKRDAWFQGGHAIGPHQTWYEDGSPRWKGAFVGELQWDGHIVDRAPDGTILWDAEFDHGRYLSGTYPESEQENLIKAGMLKPEDAVYPRKEAAGTNEKETQPKE